MNATTMLLLVLTACAARTAMAQLDARLRTGAQVRLKGMTSETPIFGKISAMEGDTLVLDRSRHALSDIGELAVYARGKGAQTTAIVFGTIGFLTGSAVYLKWCAANSETCEIVEEDEDPYDDEDPNSPFAFVSLGTAMLFAGIGYALSPPTWQIVDLPVRIGVVPVQRGVGVYVSTPAPRFIRAR